MTVILIDFLTANHRLNVLIMGSTMSSLRQHDFVTIRLNHKLLDVFGEHSESLILLRVRHTFSKLNIVWIDHQGIIMIIICVTLQGSSLAWHTRLHTLSVV